jgi:hypothetical protein
MWNLGSFRRATKMQEEAGKNSPGGDWARAIFWGIIYLTSADPFRPRSRYDFVGSVPITDIPNALDHTSCFL